MTGATSRPKIVLDCDPGLDDMFAIFCALRYCDLLAITSVAGNVGIDHTTYNALGIAALAGSSVPVHRGAARPINGSDAVDARHVHGESGLGGIELPTFTTDVASKDAVGALFDETAAAGVTVVAVGPLTNIAQAIQRDKSWIDRIERLSDHGRFYRRRQCHAVCRVQYLAGPGGSSRCLRQRREDHDGRIEPDSPSHDGFRRNRSTARNWLADWQRPPPTAWTSTAISAWRITASNNRRCMIRAQYLTS